MACEVRKEGESALLFTIQNTTIRGFVTAREGVPPEERVPLVRVQFTVGGTTVEGVLTDGELTSWINQLKQAVKDTEEQWAIRGC